ncbi:MAG TPA: VWA domain-containing protein [Dehalococcoidia bacterium]|nr:VWA domain-containing protein [Dehalococcoidia bacterium]
MELSVLVALLISAVFAAAPVRADNHQTARIIEVDDSDFPRVRVVLSVAEVGGRPVTGLGAGAFQAEETGAAANVASVQSVVDQRIGVAVVLTIDTSGSMAGNAITQAKAAAGTFLRSLQPVDQAALISFSDNVNVLTALALDRTPALQEVDRLQAVGNTALYTGVARSVEVARSASLARRAIILLSDGQDFGGVSTVSRDESLRLAAEAGVPVYAIGLGPSIDRAYLEQLAGQTGGAFFAAPTPAAIPGIYQQLAELLRSQYVLTIESSAPADVRQRSLFLRINTGSGTLEVRADYTTRRTIPDPTAVPAEVAPLPPPPDKSDNSQLIAIVLAAILVVGVTAVSGRYVQAKVRDRKLAAELAVLAARAASELKTAPEGPRVDGAFPRLSLVVAGGPSKGQRYPIGDEPLTLGAREGCHIRLEGIADEYARVWYRDGKLMFHRLDGRVHGGGAWLSLGPGDSLEVGPHALVVESE